MGPEDIVDDLSQDISWVDDELVVLETDDYFETHDDYETFEKDYYIDTDNEAMF